MALLEKTEFFERMDEMGLALTYDDVRLRTRSGSDAPMPDFIDLQSQFSENVGLKVPFVSAAMADVTGGDMAIEMAKFGGLGVIHSAMSIAQQRLEVRRVKKEVNGIIEEPVCVNEFDTLSEVLDNCRKRKYKFRSFPVVDNEGKFIGMITEDDFKFPDSLSIAVGKAMTPQESIISAEIGISFEDAYHIMQSSKKDTLPLLRDDGSVGAMYTFKDVSRIYRNIDHYNVNPMTGQLRSAAAVSTRNHPMKRIKALAKYLDVVVLDTADGDAFHIFGLLDKIKSKYPDLDVVVGNISDGASARELAEHGANGIKVGQGPGSICTTRIETGIGMPQVTAVHDCVTALGRDFEHIPVCADGGISQRGDISIAIAARANSVMMGRMLAGALEAPGEVYQKSDGSLWKRYRGQGSREFLSDPDNESSRDRYDVRLTEVFVPEGIPAEVPVEGRVEEILGMCAAALRKSMRYCKAPSIEQHRQRTNLVRITNAGLRESHPHDVSVV